MIHCSGWSRTVTHHRIHKSQSSDGKLWSFPLLLILWCSGQHYVRNVTTVGQFERSRWITEVFYVIEGRIHLHSKSWQNARLCKHDVQRGLSLLCRVGLCFTKHTDSVHFVNKSAKEVNLSLIKLVTAPAKKSILIKRMLEINTVAVVATWE